MIFPIMQNVPKHRTMLNPNYRWLTRLVLGIYHGLPLAAHIAPISLRFCILQSVYTYPQCILCTVRINKRPRTERGCQFVAESQCTGGLFIVISDVTCSALFGLSINYATLGSESTWWSGYNGCGIRKDKEDRQRGTTGRYHHRALSVKISKLSVTNTWTFFCDEKMALNIVVNIEKQIVGTENDFAGPEDEDIGKMTGTETIDRLRVSGGEVWERITEGEVGRRMHVWERFIYSMIKVVWFLPRERRTHRCGYNSASLGWFAHRPMRDIVGRRVKGRRLGEGQCWCWGK